MTGSRPSTKDIPQAVDAPRIAPRTKRWDDFFLNGPHASDDFMVERSQPALEERIL